MALSLSAYKINISIMSCWSHSRTVHSLYWTPFILKNNDNLITDLLQSNVKAITHP